jgi:hypothetical protein
MHPKTRTHILTRICSPLKYENLRHIHTHIRARARTYINPKWECLIIEASCHILKYMHTEVRFICACTKIVANRHTNAVLHASSATYPHTHTHTPYGIINSFTDVQSNHIKDAHIRPQLKHGHSCSLKYAHILFRYTFEYRLGHLRARTYTNTHTHTHTHTHTCTRP